MKKAWAMIVAVIMLMNFACLAVFAAEYGMQFVDSGGILVFDKDGRRSDSFVYTPSSPEAEIKTPENCAFDKTYYFAIDEGQITQGYASNSSYFRTSITNKKNFNYLDEVSVTSRTYNGKRYDVVKVKIKESGKTDEEEIRFTLTLKARKDAPSNGGWSNDDEFAVNFRLFASNDSDDSGDADPDAGDNLVFRPVVNDDNTITWGTEANPVATLEFEASSDADDFYAKLSTKVNSRIYEKYGDPADAELFFRTFSGDSIDATSRGTLTLYNPWADDNYRYAPNPRDVYIYRVDGNNLVDITDKFTYVREDDTPEGIEGWEIRTRVLDAYVISDKQLDDNYYDDDLPPVDELPPDNNDGGTTARPINPSNGLDTPPSTGSHDFVPIALIAGAASLAAVVLAKKRKKN